MTELTRYWVAGIRWHTKEACEESCKVIHARLGMREVPVEMVKAEDYDALRQQVVDLERERDEAVRLSRYAVHDALLSAGHTHHEHTAAVFGQWKQAIDEAIRAEQQLAQRDVRIAELEQEREQVSAEAVTQLDRLSARLAELEAGLKPRA